MALQRTIGPWGILFASVGAVIGSGWLFGPFYAAKIAGPAAIFSWIFGGILMLFIAFTFVELSTMLPIAGGIARFSHFSHGTLVSFTMSWCGWLASMVTAPIETMALLQYASNYLPWLVHEVNETHVLSLAGMFFAAIVLFVTCLINYFGIKWVSKTNIAIVAFKIAVPTLTVLFLLYTKFTPSNFVEQGFSPYGWKGVLSAMPSAGVIFSFIGYNAATQLAGEAKNPEKMIPIAILGSFLITIILYVALQIAFIGAVDLDSSWNTLSFVADNGPFVGLATLLGLYGLVLLLYLDAIISPFGTALVYTSATARINYAMSLNGYMPTPLQNLTKRGVPWNAILVNYLIGLFLFLPFPGWQSMVKFLVSSFVISYAVGPIALIALREKLPNQKRVFSIPFAHPFCLLSFYICNLLSFWTGWNVISRLLISIFLGYVFLFFYRRRKKDIMLHVENAWWIFPYLIGTGVLSFLGSFGGGLGLLPFGWDFLVIGIFSVAIFYLAKSLSLQDHHVQEMLADIVGISHTEVDCFKE
ncbi:MAG: APC family permease [Chlamydiota bacterium]